MLDPKTPNAGAVRKSVPAAVRIVGRIANELIVAGDRPPFVEAIGAVGLDLGLVTQVTVADQYPQASGREVGPRLGRETFEYIGQVDPIVFPPL